MFLSNKRPVRSINIKTTLVIKHFNILLKPQSY